MRRQGQGARPMINSMEHRHSSHGNDDHGGPHGPCCADAPSPAAIVVAASADETVEYTCPMHPEVVQKGPGSCPICGMALEPRVVRANERPDPEFLDMRRRFVFAALVSAPVLFLGMSDVVPGDPIEAI